jgi:transmembrane sensor
MSDEDRIVSEASAWHVAGQRDDMDWAAFTNWLEADARHARAYDEIALADALIDRHRTALLAAARLGSISDEAPADARPPHRGPRWRLPAGLALAASLAGAAILLAPQLLNRPQVFETREESRRIALGDGSAVTLAPHSRLTISGTDEGELTLAGGAWFDIRHNPDRELAITAGQAQIRDIGTSFDVQAKAKSVRVAVLEGHVTVASEMLAQPIRLERGRSLLFDGEQGSALVRSSPVAEIGGWRRGRLSYDDTPLPLVLDDLSRYAGVRAALGESLRERHFSGSLVIDDGDVAIRDLAEVMDLELSRSESGYGLRERSR